MLLRTWMSNVREGLGLKSRRRSVRVRRRLSYRNLLLLPRQAEILESRTLLTAVWIGGGNDFLWNDSANWSGGSGPGGGPGPGDNVAIGDLGGATVSVSGPSVAIQSLTTLSPIDVSGTSFSLTGISEIDAALQVDTGGSLSLRSATINGAGQIAVGTGTTLTTFDAALNTGVVNAGTWLVYGNNSVDGQLTTLPGSAITLSNTGIGAASIELDRGFTNYGLIDLTGTSTNYETQFTLDSGVLVNAPGGMIEVNTPTGDVGGTEPRYLDATLENQGTINVTGMSLVVNQDYVHPGGSSTNSGTIDVTGGNLSIFNENLTNSGTITVAAGLTLALIGGTFDDSMGTLGVTGAAVTLSSTIATFDAAVSPASLTTSGGSVTLLGDVSTVWSISFTTVNGPGRVLNPAHQTLTTYEATLNTGVVNAGTWLVYGNNAVNGQVTTLPGSAITLSNTGIGAASIELDRGFTNYGLIDLTGTSTNYETQFTLDSGVLVNAPGGMIEVNTPTGDVGGTEPRYLDATLENQGTINVTGMSLVVNQDYVHPGGSSTNSGTIDVTGGNLSIYSENLTNTGTITVAAGLTLAIAGGSFDDSTGTLGVTGAVVTLGSTTAILDAAVSPLSLTMDGGNVTLLGDVSTVWSISGTTVNGPGRVLNPAHQTLTTFEATLNTGVVNAGTWLAYGNNSVDGQLTTLPGSAITLSNTGIGGVSIELDRGFTNYGLIDLTGTSTNYYTQFTLDSGVLVNAVGGTIEVNTPTGDVGGVYPRYIYATLENQGTINVTGMSLVVNPDYITPGGPSTNSGTIDVTGGSLSIFNENLTNSGTITVAAGLTLAIAGGSFDDSTGTLGVTGAVVTLGSTTAILDAAVSPLSLTMDGGNVTLLGDVSTVWSISGTTVNGPGRVLNPAHQTLTTFEATLNTGVVNAGTWLAYGNNSVNGQVTTQSGSAITLSNTGIGGVSIELDRGFTNYGLIDLTGTSTYYYTQFTLDSGVLVNAPGGTIEVNTPTGDVGGTNPRYIYATVQNQGTINVTGMSLDVNPDYITSGGPSTNSGTIDVTGGNLSIYSENLTNTGTITVAAGLTLAISGGTFDDSLGTLGVTGAVVTLGSTTAILDAAVSPLSLTMDGGNVTLLGDVSTVWSISGTTVNGPGRVLNPAHQTLTTFEATLNTGVVNAGTWLAYGNNSVDGQLTTLPGSAITLSNTGIGGVSIELDRGFTNYGLIDLTGTSTNYYTQFTLDSGVLVNAVGGTIEVNTPTGDVGGVYPRYLYATVQNQGTINVTGMSLDVNPDYITSGGPSTNSGTINVTGGNLSIFNENLTNSGAITVAPGLTLAISGGTFDDSLGTLGVTGAVVTLGSTTAILDAAVSPLSLTMDGGNVTLLGDVSTVWSISGTTVNGPGRVLNPAHQTLTTFEATLNTGVVNAGTWLAYGNNSVDGQLATLPGSAITLSNTGIGGVSIELDRGFTNYGVIDLTGTSTNYYTELTLDSGVLVNALGGVIEVNTPTGDVGGSELRYVYATLENQGTINVTGMSLVVNPDYISPGGPSTNSGTINVTGGNLSINQNLTNTTSGTFEDQADCTIGGSGIFTNLGLFVKSATTGTTNFSLPFTNGGIVQVSSGILSLQNYNQTAGGTIVEQIAGLTAGTQYGQIIINGNVSLDGSLGVQFINGFSPNAGNQFTVINNQGAAAISGVLAGLPEGSKFADASGHQFQVSYLGGAGNSLVITEINTPPANLVVTPSAASIYEGGLLNLNGSFADPDPGQTHSITINWGDGSPATTVSLLAGVFSFRGQTHVYSDNPLGQPNGAFIVTTIVTDQAGGVSAPATFPITVMNVAPTASISGPTDGFKGVSEQLRTFVLSASDVSPVDQLAGFTFAINWGDGQIGTLSGPSGLSASHTYAAAGNYVIRQTATDKDGGVSAVVSTPITILASEQQGTSFAIGGVAASDNFTVAGVSTGKFTWSLNAGRAATISSTAVQVYGGPATNSVVFNGTAGNDAFSILSSSVTLLGITLGGSNIQAWTALGLAGNDVFTVSAMGLPITLDGGTGTNTLVGPNQPDTWNISALNGGTLNGVAFANMTNVTGGSSGNTFTFQNGGSISGKLSGGAGTDTLDLTGLISPVTVNDATMSVSGLIGSFVSLESIAGNSALANSFVGPNKAVTWTMTSAHTGTVNGVAFSGLQTLTGGTSANTLVGSTQANNLWYISSLGGGSINGVSFANMTNLTGGANGNVFQFESGGSIAGTLTGGGTAGNRMDFTDLGANANVTVNDQAMTVSAGLANLPLVKSFANFDSFTHSGAFVDGTTNEFIGPNKTVTWALTGLDVGTVNGVGFSGFGNLVGGTGADTFDVFPGAGYNAPINGGYGTGINTLVGPNQPTLTTWEIGGGYDGEGLLGTYLTFGSNINNLTGGGGGNTFVFQTGGSISGKINGGAGFNTLDFTGLTTPVAVNDQSQSVSGLVGSFTSVESIVVNGALANTLVGPNQTNNWAVTGPNSGSLNGVSFTGFGNLTGGTGTDIFTFGTGASVTGVVDGGLGTNTLLGANQANTWNISIANGGKLNASAFANMNNLTGGSLGNSFSFINLGTISGKLIGGTGIDSLNFNLASPLTVNDATLTVSEGTVVSTPVIGSFASIESFSTAGSSSTFVGPNQANNWVLTGSNAGRLNVTTTFTGFYFVTGGKNSDTFSLGTGSFTGSIDGGSGTNTLLGRDNAVNTWTISSANGGHLLYSFNNGPGNTSGVVNFANMANLVGNESLADTFSIVAGGSISGLVSGGGGTNNLLSFGAYLTSGVNVDLLLGSATTVGTLSNIIASISNITVVGGSGHGGDILVGDANANILDADRGDNIVIGGAGADILGAGVGADILIGGTTKYDRNLAALDTILATWQTVTPATYSSVVAKIMSNTFADPLTAKTVSDDGAIDMLSGMIGTISDWFFALTTGPAADIITNQNGGTITVI